MFDVYKDGQFVGRVKKKNIKRVTGIAVKFAELMAKTGEEYKGYRITLKGYPLRKPKEEPDTRIRSVSEIRTSSAVRFEYIAEEDRKKNEATKEADKSTEGDHSKS